MSRRHSLVILASCLLLAGAVAFRWAISGPDRFERIRPGMSAEQVIAVVGRPPDSEGSGGDLTYVMKWEEGTGQTVVVFDLNFDPGENADSFEAKWTASHVFDERSRPSAWDRFWKAVGKWF